MATAVTEEKKKRKLFVIALLYYCGFDVQQHLPSLIPTREMNGPVLIARSLLTVIGVARWWIFPENR